MAENRRVQSNAQFTVEIHKRKSVVYEVAVLESEKVGFMWNRLQFQGVENP